MSTAEKANDQQSYYYSNKYEIMSLKEFVIILEESKRKKDIKERMWEKKKGKEFVQQVGRNIQSSQSQRNLRLTMSSASRISSRMKQLRDKNLFY